ncbi:MAG: DNA polymerase IV [Bacteroidales bacterium]|nr:DNA polymerase IV [Bacteroidales bacterium]
MTSYRKIIHVDMDAFYASVEQRDNRLLRGKPIVVGGDSKRGVVATASYEARTFGIHSAMPIATAKNLCKELIIVPPRFEVYTQVSEEIRQIFEQYTDVIEPIALDEAFLDVTHNKKDIVLAQDIAMEIKEKIKKETLLTASAGVSYNKFLAKIASDYRKPDGLFVIHPQRALEFIDGLSIEKFWGVGKKTLEIMNMLGIFRGKDLRRMSLDALKRNFGKAGVMFYDFARGIDNREVEKEHIRKSVGCEHTFERDIDSFASVTIELYNVVLELCDRIKESGFHGVTLTLKVKYFDFSSNTRSFTQRKTFKTKDQILPVAKKLMNDIDYRKKPLRLIGLTVSNHKESDLKTKKRFSRNASRKNPELLYENKTLFYKTEI